MTVPGVPDMGMREAKHADAEPPVVRHAHARHEKLVTNLEEEEGSVPFGAKPLVMLIHEVDDLRLGESEFVEIITHSPEDLLEGTVLDHLVDRNLGFLRGRASDVRAIPLEVWIDPAGESFRRFRDGFLPICLVKFENFGAGDEFDDTGNVLSDLSKHFLHGPRNRGDHLVTTGPHIFNILLVDHAVLGELAERHARCLASSINYQRNAGLDLILTDFI